MLRWLPVLLALAAPPAAADPAADEAAIRQRLAEWTAAFNARDTAGACGLFAPDLRYTVPGITDGTQAMICANFVVEQLDQKIVLPTAATAKSLDRTESSLLFINVDETGRLLPVDGGTPILDPRAIETYMKRQFARRLSITDGNKEEAEKTLVIIRAHEASKFEAVYRVLRAIKQSGFKRLQLRAKIA